MLVCFAFTNLLKESNPLDGEAGARAMHPGFRLPPFSKEVVVILYYNSLFSTQIYIQGEKSNES